jgi:predicted ATPase
VVKGLELQLTPFVGRENERLRITELMADPTCRLLTLVGPGGIGKTRLASEAARQFANAYFIPLQSLNTPDLIPSMFAKSLGFQFYTGSEPIQQLLDYLREKAYVLLLDNFEHLLEGVTLLSQILAYAPHVQLLVTSRERLNLVEECVLDLEGLPYPASELEADIGQYGAVDLFVQHARRVKASFQLSEEYRPAVARICRLVGGMPLGIELAASWVRVLSCTAIANEIEHNLDILQTSARNVEPRHQTMRGVIDQSWQLLSDTERAVYMKLSVFRGGFTREAAELVAGTSLANPVGADR